MHMLNDRDLIIQLKDANLKAFDTLYYRYCKKVRQFCFQITGTMDESDEIVQLAFLAVWENRFKIDPDRSFETYLFAIVRNHLYNFLKRKAVRSRFIEVNTGIENFEEMDPSELIYIRDLNDLLQKLTDSLPERRREIFLMHREMGFTYKQIAEKLNISENTVDTQIRNVLNFFRSVLVKFLK